MGQTNFSHRRAELTEPRPCRARQACLTSTGGRLAACSAFFATAGAVAAQWGQHMNRSDRLLELCRGGRMSWTGQGWIAEPEEVMEALASDGFQECKREVARSPVDRRPAGGVWQGLNNQTGAVASAVWVQSPDQSLVFIEIDGRPLAG